MNGPTEGQWRFEMHPTGWNAEIVTTVPTPSGKGGRRIIARTSDSSEAEANAALISAAPEMYKALKRVDKFFQENFTEEEMTWWHLVRDALTKAESTRGR